MRDPGPSDSPVAGDRSHPATVCTLQSYQQVAVEPHHAASDTMRFNGYLQLLQLPRYRNPLQFASGNDAEGNHDSLLLLPSSFKLE